MRIYGSRDDATTQPKDEPVTTEQLGELADELRVLEADGVVVVDPGFLASIVHELRTRRLHALTDEEARLVRIAVRAALREARGERDTEALAVALDKLQAGAS